MKKQDNQFLIDSTTNGLRLDMFLTQSLDLSRSQIQKLVKAGQFKVNQEVCTSAHLKLKQGDKVLFELQPEKIVLPVNTTMETEPKVLLENNDYIVLNKPSGLMVHPAANNPQVTLVDWLLEKYPQVKKVGENVQRPGIIHRLDRDVSGAMLVALNQKTYAYFKKQFQDHNIKKTYTALVHGKVESPEMLIDFPLIRSRRAGRIVAQPKNKSEGRQAQTLLTLDKQFQQTALVFCQPITGRTHQIRVHCKAVGHPIVGDTIYGPKKSSLNPGRIFLHSTKLEFIDHLGEKVTINCPLPKILKDYLKTLSK